MIENEQTKLTATWLNGISIAVFAVGGLAPLLSSVYAGNEAPIEVIGLIVAVCFVGSGALHILARHQLRRLKP